MRAIFLAVALGLGLSVAGCGETTGSRTVSGGAMGVARSLARLPGTQGWVPLLEPGQA